MARQPDGPPARPVQQRLRLRYAKRGRLRFTSHRDFARAFERALRRAGIPMAYSAGFHPHPKISYLGAAPTGVASEAEYLEIGLADRREPEQVRTALDACLPPGLDLVECVEAAGGSLAERIDASRWQVELTGLDPTDVVAALDRLMAEEQVFVQRLTKDGRRDIDARSAVVSATVTAGRRSSAVSPDAGTDLDRGDCAILDLVVRQLTPAVRPDDVIAALATVAGLVPPVPVRATRMAQGRLDESGQLADPLAPDRVGPLAAREGAPSTVDGAQR